MTLRTVTAMLAICSCSAYQVPMAPRTGTARTMASPMMADTVLVDNVFASSASTRVEGKTLKTWDIGDASIPRAQMSIKSSGRPVHTRVELWHTPAYIPTKFSAYTEDARLRPIDCVIETPKHPKTVAVFNEGPQEFPFEACVANTGLGPAYGLLAEAENVNVQGGQITSYTFGTDVDAVQILIKPLNGERNIKARIELTQGPNQIKQSYELYASSGYKNPFYTVMQTPGADSTIRVLNQNNVEFPFNVWVVPCSSSAPKAPVSLGGAFA